MACCGGPHSLQVNDYMVKAPGIPSYVEVGAPEVRQAWMPRGIRELLHWCVVHLATVSEFASEGGILEKGFKERQISKTILCGKCQWFPDSLARRLCGANDAAATGGRLPMDSCTTTCQTKKPAFWPPLIY